MTHPKLVLMKIRNINKTFQEMPANSEMQIREIMAAIKRGDKLPPIIVSPAGYLQDGRHRLEAYRRLGYTDINVILGYHPAAKVVNKRSLKK